MVVNYVDVALALIIVAYIISGWKRGFFITVLNFVRYAFGFALCFYISDNSAQAVYDDYVKERALERINEKIVTSDKAPQLLENLQQAVNALPKDIAGSLDISSVNLSSKNVSQEILDNLFKPILMFLTQAALFVAVFIVFFGATAVIMYYVKRAKKTPPQKREKGGCYKGGLFLRRIVRRTQSGTCRLRNRCGFRICVKSVRRFGVKSIYSQFKIKRNSFLV